MELTGTFEFSHVNMVVINKTTVYRKELVGKKQIPLWRMEHHPKVYQPEDIKEIIQGYLRSPYHRVCPSCDTINIYHKTKRELANEKNAADKLCRDLQKHTEACIRKGTMVCVSTPKSPSPFVCIDDTRPGQLIRAAPR